MASRIAVCDDEHRKSVERAQFDSFPWEMLRMASKKRVAMIGLGFGSEFIQIGRAHV